MIISDNGNTDNFVLDNGLVCRWINGQAKVSPKITGYYISDKKGRNDFADNFEENILPLFYDTGFVITQMHDLLVQDNSISEMQRQKLNSAYPCKTKKAQAEYITDLLLFGMERNFVKRDTKTKELLTAGNFSPMVADYIYENEVPKPCRHFCGRDSELDALHKLLTDEGKVFLHGIAGIGKSELAKAYAKQYKKEYTNILYIIYSGDLMRDVTGMDFSDDLPEDTDDERFRKHNRFLRSLKEDTLIIIDNFNTNDLAAYHMEQGISILEKYGLIYMNQSIAQICNYAVLLHDIGESESGFSALRRCAKTVKEHNSELSSDYAAIQEAVGNINLACGRLDKAREHLQKALSIYEQLWSDEPQHIESKQKEILQQYAAAGLGIGSIFLIK